MRFQWITNIPFWRGPRRRKGIVVVRFGWTWTCLDPVGKSNNRAPECWSKFLVNRRITFSIMDENEAIKWISSPPSSPVLVPDKQFQFTHCQWGNLTMDHIIHKIRIIFIFDYHNFGNWIEFFIANLYLSPTYTYLPNYAFMTISRLSHCFTFFNNYITPEKYLWIWFTMQTIVDGTRST